jgi:pyruvate kinase
MRRAKIVATIGPATESAERLRDLMLAGMDVARINMSHGERESHGEVIDRIRQVSARLRRPVAVMLDLSGPKIRTGKLRDGEVALEEGAELRIVSEEIEGDAARISTNYALLPREVRTGERVLISDGEIELQVLSVDDEEVVTRVVHGGLLGERKGINLPGAQISIPSITDKDLADLRFGIERDIDLVAQSFVRSAADCLRARELIREMGGRARLIAKIEKPEAMDDFTNILRAVDGVMVARGDLAVETSTERVPVLQKRIIAEALEAEKTTITATQMLQSMIENPRPTRAEASDVSNAVLDGSDALMLSGETAIGRFPVETVRMMARIVRATEEMVTTRTGPLAHSLIGRRSGSVGRAVSEAAAFAADEIGCQLIVVISESGHMARRIAALRPRQRIIAVSPLEKSQRQLAITWGVEPYPLVDCGSADGSLLACVDRTLLENKLAERGEMVIVMAGRLPDIAVSLSMKIHQVGDLVNE